MSRRPAGGGPGSRWSVPALVLLLLVLAGIAAAAYYPFHLRGSVANDVHRTGDGLAFGAHNTALTPATPAWVPEAVRRDAFYLHLSLNPRVVTPVEETVLAAGQGADHANVTVWQEGRDVLVGMRSAGGSAQLFARDVLAPSRWTDLTVDVRPRVATLQVNGRAVDRVGLPERALSTWDRRCRLALGGDVTSESTWSGRVRTATVTAGAATVDYLNPGTLDVPADYRTATHWEPLVPQERVDVVVDVLHLLVFVPLGFLVVLVRRPPLRPGSAVAVATVLSVGLVCGKLLFLGRHPGEADLVLQPIGATLGVLLATSLVPRRGLPGAPPSIRPRPEPPD